MFCLSLVGPSLQEVESQLKRAIAYKADLIEFRVDLFDPEVLPHLGRLRGQATIPVIFKGGGREHAPDYFDGEGGEICSYHNYQQTPKDLEQILADLPRAPLYKIATFANSTNDALRMLLFARAHPGVLGMCMGPKGLVTRILGSPWRYAALSEHERSAPGQPTFHELQSYRVSQNLYGLIGGVTVQSPSHVTHNHLIRQMGWDATYLKMIVQPEELGEFVSLAKATGFKGLSVTMPLKEAILPFVDELQTDLGAVNTLSFEGGRVIGRNTDALAARSLLPDTMHEVVILGAGGTARAIATLLRQEGISVTVLNRSLGRDLVDGTLERADQIPYDVLINCTPHPSPISLSHFATVMDVNLKPTRLLQEATKLGCPVIEGWQLFIGQAALQFAHWFQVPSEKVLAYLASLKEQIYPSSARLV